MNLQWRLQTPNSRGSAAGVEIGTISLEHGNSLPILRFCTNTEGASSPHTDVISVSARGGSGGHYPFQREGLEERISEMLPGILSSLTFVRLTSKLRL